MSACQRIHHKSHRLVMKRSAVPVCPVAQDAQAPVGQQVYVIGAAPLVRGKERGIHRRFQYAVRTPITRIGGTYYINYTAVSIHGITTALAETEDFVHVRKHGVIFVTENRDVCIFPDKIGGKYYSLVRPVPRQIGSAKIWVAASDDLLHWGEFTPLPLPRFGWDGMRNGGGAVPVRTDRGWLVLYHGADRESNRYSMGAALLAADDPRKVLAVSRRPVLYAEAPYETAGFYPNVVFSCGAFLEKDTVYMYYGAADRVMGLARADLAGLWAVMEPV